MKFKDLPKHKKRGKIYYGNLYIPNLEITSLEGCYNEVQGNVILNFNRLKDLEYCPEIVKGDFDCSFNFLKTLKYFPKIIEGVFYCNNNLQLHNPKKQIIENGIKAKKYITDEGDFTFDEINKEIILYKKKLKLLKESKMNLSKQKIFDYGLGLY